jgi:hypothetical protein
MIEQIEPKTNQLAETNEQDINVALMAQNTLLNVKALNLLSRVATKYANSSVVPDNYARNPDNCFVACELAARMNVSPILVMQNLYIVKGKPAWSGQACISLINGSGQFDSPLDFVFVGDRGSDQFGCYAVTSRNGRELRSTTITMKMAADEGWLNKQGSKWKTMPEQMMMYRSAAFFARVYCPNLLMGFSTEDEVRDIQPEEKPKETICL